MFQAIADASSVTMLGIIVRLPKNEEIVTGNWVAKLIDISVDDYIKKKTDFSAIIKPKETHFPPNNEDNLLQYNINLLFVWIKGSKCTVN